MKHYIAISTEGFTQDSCGNEVQNSQVLGMAVGENYHVAARKVKEYLIKNKMDFKRFTLYELKDDTPIRYHIDMV